MRAPLARMVASVCLVVGVAAPSAAGAASSPVVTAEVPSPAAGALLQASYRLYDYVDRSLVRVESRPAPDTIVLRTYGYREELHGRVFRRLRTRACGRMLVRATIHPGPGVPLKLAEGLLPAADEVAYSAELIGAAGTLGASATTPKVKVVRSRDIHRWRRGATAAETVLTDWHQDGQDGYAALSAVGTVRSTAAACRPNAFNPLPFFAPESD